MLSPYFYGTSPSDTSTSPDSRHFRKPLIHLSSGERSEISSFYFQISTGHWWGSEIEPEP